MGVTLEHNWKRGHAIEQSPKKRSVKPDGKRARSNGGTRRKAIDGQKKTGEPHLNNAEEGLEGNRRGHSQSRVPRYNHCINKRAAAENEY